MWRSALAVFLYYDDGVTTSYVLGHDWHHHCPGDLAKERASTWTAEDRAAMDAFIRENEGYVEIWALEEGGTIHVALRRVWQSELGRPFSHTEGFAVWWLKE